MIKFNKQTPKGVKFLIFYLIIGLFFEIIRTIATEPLQVFLLNIIITAAIAYFMIWGLLKAKNWMRILVLIATIIGIPLSILLYTGYRLLDVEPWFRLYMGFYVVLDIILSTIAIWFLLFDKDVKTYFTKRTNRKTKAK